MESRKQLGWYWSGLLLVLYPFVVNAVLNRHSIVLESSIFSIDYSKYFSDLFHFRSHFFTGQYSIQLLGYSVLYALLYAAGLIFGSGAGYFIVVGLFYWLGYHYLVKLLSTIGKKVSAKSENNIALQALLAVLFFSSLAMFNFVKSNIIFILPYLILPAILYWGVEFLEKARAKYLLLILIALLLGTTFNVTHFVLLGIFTCLFLGIYGATLLKLKGKTVFGRVSLVAVTFVPSFVFLAVLALTNSVYGGSVSEFASAVSENFYSLGAHYLNIFQQTTDWGLFGSWQGELYYGFSPFYERGVVIAFGLMPYLLLIAAYAFLPKHGKVRFSVAALGLMVFIFQFMLGFHNPVYRFLYDNVFGFQIFRNITKAAPLLLLALVIAIYSLVLPNIGRVLRVGVMLVLLTALLYNAPYWAYADKFFTDRTIKEVPTYWQQTAAYLNDHATSDDRVLVLPATYILEQYHWPEGKRNVQGHLLDSLLRNDLQSYRLGQILIGPLEMQKDMGRIFIPSERSVRGLDTNYVRLTEFTKKYGTDYVVMSNDLVSEYQHPEDVIAWLTQSGYAKVSSFGQVDVYYNSALRTVTSTKVTRVTNTDYLITVPRSDATREINALPYSSAWQLYATKPGATNDPWLRPGVSIAAEHSVGPNYTNKWTLSDEAIKNVSSEDTVTLRAIFSPQRYLYLGLLAFSALFALLLLTFGYAAVIQRKKLS